MCLAAVTSLPCNEDFLIADPSRTLHLQEVFFVGWATGPSSLRVGALVELGYAFDSDGPS